MWAFCKSISHCLGKVSGYVRVVKTFNNVTMESILSLIRDRLSSVNIFTTLVDIGQPKITLITLIKKKIKGLQ